MKTMPKVILPLARSLLLSFPLHLIYKNGPCRFIFFLLVFSLIFFHDYFSFFFSSELQHTLVTEIRELIFPEDRTRYDELVYRRGRSDVYGDSMDRHRVSNLLGVHGVVEKMK